MTQELETKLRGSIIENVARRTSVMRSLKGTLNVQRFIIPYRVYGAGAPSLVFINGVQQSMAIVFGFVFNKIVADDSPLKGTIYTLKRLSKLPRTNLKLLCSPPVGREKAWRRGYSGSDHQEIVVYRAYAEAVFLERSRNTRGIDSM